MVFCFIFITYSLVPYTFNVWAIYAFKGVIPFSLGIFIKYGPCSMLFMKCGLLNYPNKEPSIVSSAHLKEFLESKEDKEEKDTKIN